MSALADLLEEAGSVAMRDADAIYDQYRWPPRPELTTQERGEAERLTVLARRMWVRAFEVRAGMRAVGNPGSQKGE